MQILQSFQNIFKIPELRNRILWTFGLLIVYRLGSHIPLPGVNPMAVKEFSDQMSREGGDLFGLIQVFTGGAIGNLALFSLGIMPYITSSIIMQLMTKVSPNLEAIAKEGPSGTRKIQQYTRYAAVPVCFVQGFFAVKQLAHMSGSRVDQGKLGLLINDGYGMPAAQPFYAIRLGSSGDISLPEGARTSSHTAWSMKRGGQWSMTTPLVYGDLLYTCSNNGIVACYNARSGERVYYQRLGGKGGGYTASPVAADGKVYFTSEDGEIFVIKAGPKYEQLAANPMGETCMATPAISDGMIFVRTQHQVFGIGEPKSKGKN